MQVEPRHRWDVTPAEARRLQAAMAAEVDVTTPLADSWQTVAAADVSFDRYSPVLHAAVVVVDRASGTLTDSAVVSAPAAFPYVPGLLSFREAPAVLEAFGRLETVPDVLLCDGQGRAHPRRLGLACHLGLWLGLPAIGCAKSRLCGEYDEPGPQRGDRAPLIDRGEVVGAVLRTRDRVAPLYVSPGHRCDLESAVRVVLELVGKYRLPEPARLAHRLVNEARREALADADGCD
jgi:deoxyribonuclease V